MTQKVGGFVIYSEREKAELGERIGLRNFLKGLNEHELYVVWVLVGRIYSDAQFREIFP